MRNERKAATMGTLVMPSYCAKVPASPEPMAASPTSNLSIILMALTSQPLPFLSRVQSVHAIPPALTRHPSPRSLYRIAGTGTLDLCQNPLSQTCVCITARLVLHIPKNGSGRRMIAHKRCRGYGFRGEESREHEAAESCPATRTAWSLMSAGRCCATWMNGRRIEDEHWMIICAFVRSSKRSEHRRATFHDYRGCM